MTSENPARQVVVVSDIHLGEDLVEKGPASLQHYINRLNEEFVSFLSWLEIQGRERKIALVINGDMFDFVKISLRPDPREAYMRWQQGLSPHEARLGLDNTPERVLWKLERILDCHRPLFAEMARFIGAGNTLHIVAGNHDREFYYQEIMEGLTRALADIYFSVHERDDTPAERSAFSARIDFSMWFHLTDSAIYIEHGHQYDSYCSFEYLLAPLTRHGENKVALPLTHRAIPYFVDLIGEISTHNLDTKNFKDYLGALFKMGPRGLAAFLWAYMRAVGTILSEAGEKGRRARSALASAHAQERREVAQKYALDEALVRALDGLHATPAEFSFLKMVQCFYVDRFLLFFTTFFALAGEALFIENRYLRMTTLATTFLGSAALADMLGRWRRVDIRQKLREGADGVMKLLCPRMVIFGHSHKPELIRSEHGIYINIGSWVSRAALLGEADWGMTFAWVDPAGARRSGLYRWAGRQKEAALLETVEAPAAPAALEAALAQ